MAARNPFPFGRVVTGEDFADREPELAELIRDLEAGQSILLISPRRYGKTSLMVEALRRLEKRGHLTALVDLFGSVTPTDLAERFTREVVVRHYTRMESLARFLREGLGRLRPELTLHPDGTVGLGLRREAEALGEEVVLEEVLDAPQALATREKRRLMVVLDEFQEIGNLDGEWLLKLIRSKIQHHDAVSYAFTGSKKHALEQIFADPSGAFYRSARPHGLGRIPPGPFGEYIAARFDATHLRLPEGMVERILGLTEGHPYFTQQLCHEMWNLGTARGAVSEEDFEGAIERILENQGELYAQIWDGLSRYQRRMLRALATGGTDSPYASAFIKRNRLTSASHAKRSLGGLLEKQLVEKEDGTYRVADLFLREWVVRSLSAR
ncbi:MAG: ATP-binding protein [Thermoplasmata archaeon]